MRMVVAVVGWWWWRGRLAVRVAAGKVLVWSATVRLRRRVRVKVRSLMKKIGLGRLNGRWVGVDIGRARGDDVE